MFAVFDAGGWPLAFYDPEIWRSRELPAGAVELSEAQWREFVENQGRRRWDGAQVVPEEPVGQPVDLSAYANQRRWEIETGGIEVDGIALRTDERAQLKIAGAVQLTERDPSVTSIRFQAQPGQWVTLSVPQIQAIGIAVARHVQTCFEALSDVDRDIGAGAITSVAEVDAAFAAAIGA